jgi:chromosomal replication initiation ATPase DnaA
VGGSVLTNLLRPSNWSEVAGQKDNIRILKAIAKNPLDSPRSIILAGSYGTGKTSCSRILAKELNGVKSPDFDINTSSFYYEYDSSVIGNVAEIRKLRDMFGGGFSDSWKVITFDEVHCVSQQAQSAMLKILEEVTGNTIFCLCTTHVHKVLPTIRSRSLELTFDTVPHDEIVEHLGLIESKINLTIPPDIKSIIASRSYGHMRNVHMLLDKYTIMGQEMFRASVKSCLNLYCDYFKVVRAGTVDEVLVVANELLKTPMIDLKSDFSLFIREGLKALYKSENVSPEVVEVVKIYGNDFNKIVKHYFSDWFYKVYDSDYHFQNGLLQLYGILRTEITSIGNNGSNPSPNGNPRLGVMRPR